MLRERCRWHSSSGGGDGAARIILFATRITAAAATCFDLLKSRKVKGFSTTHEDEAALRSMSDTIAKNPDSVDNNEKNGLVYDKSNEESNEKHDKGFPRLKF